MNVLLQFNPEQAEKEFTEFYRCCVYRTAGNFPTKVTSGSVALIYRTQVQTIIGEFEIVRLEEIAEPTTPETKKLYKKAFGYPVTLYDGEYYGPNHYFFQNLKIYTPHVPYKKLESQLEKTRGKHIGLPRGSFLYLEREEVEYVRNQTSITPVISVVNTKFTNPFI